jgi:hypothetical protein
MILMVLSSDLDDSVCTVAKLKGMAKDLKLAKLAKGGDY